MKTASEVSADKLRGGFYTPATLADVCLDRVAELVGARSDLRILEPSAGDGVFFRRLAVHALSQHVGSCLGIEIVESEAQKCRELGSNLSFPLDVLTTSTVEWAQTTEDRFDVVIGNPPFVRFQFVSKRDLEATTGLGWRLGLPFRGVANLWIPVLLGALSRLRPGGAMAVVVPAEVFTGFSAGDARIWLLSNFERVRVDMFEPGSFPDVLQEVVVLSGIRTENDCQAYGGRRRTNFCEHSVPHARKQFAHFIPIGTESWTRYLLSPSQLEALSEANALPATQRFGAVAKLEVSIVTGANEYFSIDHEICEEYELQPWVKPLLPRIRHARGLIYTGHDHETIKTDGTRAWLLDFGEAAPDPLLSDGAARYLALGERQGLHTRYKTSIRMPWYRVPSIRAGKLLMSKRSHRFPRLVLNTAGVLTTDTIYRGGMTRKFEGLEDELVATFHNSLTLLTAELEGRSFGGGVLELVPSEISRLAIPFPTNLGGHLTRLDCLTRECASGHGDQEAIVAETDRLIHEKVPGFTQELLDTLRDARELLLHRRLSRN